MQVSAGCYKIFQNILCGIGMALLETARVTRCVISSMHFNGLPISSCSLVPAQSYWRSEQCMVKGIPMQTLIVPILTRSTYGANSTSTTMEQVLPQMSNTILRETYWVVVVNWHTNTENR